MFTCPHCGEEEADNVVNFSQRAMITEYGAVTMNGDGDEEDRDYQDQETEDQFETTYSCRNCREELSETEIRDNITAIGTTTLEEGTNPRQIKTTEEKPKIIAPKEELTYSQSIFNKNLIECPKCGNMFKKEEEEEIIECTNPDCNHIFTFNNIIEKHNAYNNTNTNNNTNTFVDF